MNAVEVAVKMESDAIAFYRAGAEKTSNPIGKKMFLSIAEDEKHHLEMLTSVMKNLDFKIEDAKPMEKIKTIFDEMKDSMLQKISATSDELDAFKVAMEMEKEGMSFYHEQAGKAQTEKERVLFNTLAKEEEQHYAVFSNTYTYMKDSGNWFLWEERGIIEG